MDDVPSRTPGARTAGEDGVAVDAGCVLCVFVGGRGAGWGWDGFWVGHGVGMGVSDALRVDWKVRWGSVSLRVKNIRTAVRIEKLGFYF